MKKRETFNFLYLAITVFVIFVLFSSFVFSQTKQASEIYKDNDTITLIIPFSPGGGFDRLARIIQPYWQDAISELSGAKVNLIVKNVLGAGGVLGYKTMFEAQPDGKTIGMVGLAGAPFQQLATKEFDLRQFTQIGQANSENNAVAVSVNSPFNNLQDMLNRSSQEPILFATSGIGSADHTGPLIFQAILAENGIEFNMDFVHYDGTSQALLAIVKGEAEAIMDSTGAYHTMVRSGDVKVISVFSSESDPWFPNVVTITEEKIPGADQIANQIIGNIRCLVAPPNTPEPIATVLRKALEKSINNTELQKKCMDMEAPLSYASPEMVAIKVDKLMELADQFSGIILPFYMK